MPSVHEMDASEAHCPQEVTGGGVGEETGEDTGEDTGDETGADVGLGFLPPPPPLPPLASSRSYRVSSCSCRSSWTESPPEMTVEA